MNHLLLDSLTRASFGFFRVLFLCVSVLKISRTLFGLHSRFVFFSFIMCPTGTAAALARERPRNSDLRSAFDVLDVDRDGKISSDDLRRFYGGYLETTSSSEEEDFIGSMISVADANKDGVVEYEEFEKVLGPRKNGRSWNRDGNNLLEDVFRVMDKDGDGKVGHEDLKTYLTSAGFDATDDDVKAMIRLAGGDQNGGGVTYEALLRILAV